MCIQCMLAAVICNATPGTRASFLARHAAKNKDIGITPLPHSLQSGLGF